MTLLLLLAFQVLYPSTQEYQAHIKFLSDNTLAGRETSTLGQQVAARYLATQLEALGALPAYKVEDGNGYYQRFNVNLLEMNPDTVSLKLKGGGKSHQWKLDNEFKLRDRGIGLQRREAPLAFAGYGIHSDVYNDYQGLDVQGKWVIVLEGKPQISIDDAGASFQFDQKSSPRQKYKVAVDHGALGIILLTTRNAKKPIGGLRATRPMTLEKNTVEKPSSASRLLVYEPYWPELFGKSWLRFEKAVATIQETKQPQSFVLKKRSLSLVFEQRLEKKATENVVGILPGQDPILKNEYVVVSAHYDHIGVINEHIYNGADDNASGCAGLLVLANRLQNVERKRSLILLFLTGEEQGLLGSEYFVSNPCVPLHSIVADINLDMIGRSKNGSIGVIPSGETGRSTLNLLLESENQKARTPITLLGNMDSFFERSDHYNFYLKNIPALFLFSGLHEHYHHPQDDWQLLNYEWMNDFFDLLHSFTTATLNTDQKLAFLKSSSVEKTEK